MNFKISSALLFLLFCSSCYPLKLDKDGSYLLEKMFIEQNKLDSRIAVSLDYFRRMANKKSDFNQLLESKYDTLWLIERVDEVDLSTLSFAWSSDRDEIVSLASDFNGVYVKRGKYNDFKDPLKTVVEKFDTTAIIGRESSLGAKRVFISKISKQKIRTFYFSDIPDFVVE